MLQNGRRAILATPLRLGRCNWRRGASNRGGLTAGVAPLAGHSINVGHLENEGPRPRDGGPADHGSRPLSRILCSQVALRRWPSIWDQRYRSPLAAYPEVPRLRRAGHPCLLLGLAPDGVHPAAPVTRDAGELLPHPFTLTCGPWAPSAVCSLLHCAAGCPAWDFPSVLPCGVRTFLSAPRSEGAAATRPAPTHDYRTL
jgi:hypothetical protein